MSQDATEIEFHSICRIGDCEWVSGLCPSQDIAGFLSSWHVFEEHRGIWNKAIGDRLPRDPDPRKPEVYQYLIYGRHL
jgi:hypothetical protein